MKTQSRSHGRPRVDASRVDASRVATSVVAGLVLCLSLSSCTAHEEAGEAEARLPGEEAQAPSAQVPPAQEPGAGPDDSLHNTLRWQTATEVDNFGFDIFRADNEEGPFEKINGDPVAGAGTVDEPQSYVYVDRTNDPTRAYYYYVESISMANVREHFTPVLRAKAKTPVAD